MDRETKSLPTHVFVTGMCWAVTCAGIFLLPYWFPLHREDQSLSTLSGCNNSLAIAALLAGVVVLSAVAWRKKPDRWTEANREPAGLMGVTPLVLLCVIQTLITVGLLAATIGRPPAGEAQYLLGRIYPLASGMIPYRDYEFLYGPLLLYLPYGISKLFSAPLYPVYVLVFLGFELLGLYMLWRIIRASTAGPRRQRLVFCVLAAGTLPNVSLGLQYTFPRYLIAFAAVLASVRFNRRYADRPGLLCLVYISLCVAVFGLSPELGLALIPALVAVLIAQAHFFGQRIAGPTLALVASLACLAMFVPSGLLAGVLSFSRGSNSFPVVPAIFIVLYVFSVLRVGPGLVVALYRWRKDEGTILPYAPDVTAGFLVLSLAMAPGALNRADGGHVFFYGIGFFLMMLIGVGVSELGHRLFVALYILVFGALVPYTGYHVYRVSLKLPIRTSRIPEPAAGALRMLVGDTRWREWREVDRSESMGMDHLDRELAGAGPLCVPFGNSEIMFLLARRGALQPDHFVGLDNVFTHEDVRSKIAGLGVCRGLVAPEDMENRQPLDADVRISEMQLFFKKLFLYPFPVKIDRRQLPEDVEDPIRAHCLQGYRLSARLGGGLGLYLPKEVR
jgi:hypothetical protein